MEREYFTKTGVRLTVIQGGAQSDGLKRGQLQLVDSNFQPENSQFGEARVSISRNEYSHNRSVELCVELSVNAADTKRQSFIDGLVVDVNNWIYSRFNIGAHCPTIGGLKDRAKSGQKRLTFYYEISEAVAKMHGFKGKYAERLVLKHG